MSFIETEIKCFTRRLKQSSQCGTIGGFDPVCMYISCLTDALSKYRILTFGKGSEM